MRYVVYHPAYLVEDFTHRQETLAPYTDYLYDELTHAESARFYLEQQWQENIRTYNTVPQQVTRNIPYLNASNQVAPMAAEKADDIYSQIISAAMNIDPFVTARATSTTYVPHAKAVQKRLALGIKNSHWNVLPAIREGLKDLIKMGTAVWVTHWVEEHKKTRRMSVTSKGPRIKAIPIEHIIVPSGSCHSIDDVPWIAIRHEYSSSELTELAQVHTGWNIDPIQTPRSLNNIQRIRQHVANQREQPTSTTDRYDLYEIYAWYDIDHDRQEEALLTYFNLTSHHNVQTTYCPYDRFPLSKAVFDLNEYLFYGKSVLEILQHLNSLASDIINHWVDNGFLANVRMFKSRPGTLPEDTILAWAGRNLKTNDPASLDTIQLADIYPSFPLLFQLVDQLASRRVGIPSVQQTTEALGNRTPGITALSVLQNISQRHAAAFDSFRNGAAHAIKQCLYREQEQLLQGNLDLELSLRDLLGPEDAALYIQVLKDPRFDDAIAIELTASSASINREADKQNAIMVGNFALQFVPVILQLTASCGDPAAPEPLRMAIVKILTSLAEIFDNIVRSFEHIRNPEIVAVDTTPEAQLLSQLANAQQMITLATGTSPSQGQENPNAPMARNGSQRPGGSPESQGLPTGQT